MAKSKTVKNAPILRSLTTESEKVVLNLNLGKQYNFEIVYLPLMNKFMITRHDFVDNVDYSGSVELEEVE